MTKLAKARSAALVERVERRICLIRGEKVMLDSDLAALYGVPTGALNQADGMPSDSPRTSCSNSPRARRAA